MQQHWVTLGPLALAERSTTAYCSGDVLGGPRWRLMLPHAHNFPSRISQAHIGVGISTPVRCQFFRPPLSVGLWHRPVDRARMPEASVHENRHLGSGKGDIYPTTHRANYRPVHSIT